MKHYYIFVLLLLLMSGMIGCVSNELDKDPRNPQMNNDDFIHYNPWWNTNSRIIIITNGVTNIYPINTNILLCTNKQKEQGMK